MLQLVAYFLAMNILQQGLTPSLSPCLLHCASTCLADASCSSFFYQRQHQRCYISNLVYSTTSSAMINVTGVMYYSWIHPDCPRDHIFSRGAHLCFKLGVQTDWQSANATCSDSGKRLIKIDTDAKQKQMAYMSSELGDIWTGLHPIDDEFRWTDGSLVNYTCWYPGQPRVFFDFKCVVLYDLVPRAWHIGICVFLHHTVCEVVL
ncbi:C-type lectin lectoxin-Lio3-like [Haliotis cracherodii]|uniref:C-type lectin lectoxin-Lio3-like n=1 Tax=Haliotis cracherodii TaxID=6455 RepID=UPI0039E7EE4A